MLARRCLRQSSPLISLSTITRPWTRLLHSTPPQNRFWLDPFEPIPEKKPQRLSPRARSFDPEALLFYVEDRQEEDEWEATMWNGIIPPVFLAICFWGLSEKWMRTLPTANDGEFGPMRYRDNPDARYWGNYRYDIQSRKGRRQFDWGL